MGWQLETAARLVRAFRRAMTRKWAFSVLFIVIFLGSITLLKALDLLPDPPAQAPIAEQAASSTPANTTVELVEDPVKIEIQKIGLQASIADPTTTDTNVLDAWLLKGAVHYPTSAKLGEDGNVVLFGHSSYLPVVYNQAYKTFDGIQKLAAGDQITVYSSTQVYTYAVKDVSKMSANDGAIPLQVSGRELTLSTCDSFGVKSDRFVVTADFVERHAISS